MHHWRVIHQKERHLSLFLPYETTVGHRNTKRGGFVILTKFGLKTHTLALLWRL